MIKLLMNDNEAYSWYNNKKIYFRGYFFIGSVYYDKQKALDYISKIQEVDLNKEITNFNGIFSIIINYKSKLCLICDRLRGLPIFYSVGDEIVVSDRGKDIVDYLQLDDLDNQALFEYRASGLFVPGCKTLIRNLYQVQSSEIVTIDIITNNIEHCKYFRYYNDSNMYSDKEKMQDDFYDNYTQIANRLIISLKNRTAVVPLSGGADSRMIISMLKKLNYKKVICFSYGKKENKESLISQNVAMHYGYKWIMVEYKSDIWKSVDIKEILERYEEYAFNYVSTIHLQDFYAVKYLKDKKIIPDDSVFIPGHSGDLIAGSYVPLELLTKKPSNDIISNIMKKYFYPNIKELSDLNRITDIQEFLKVSNPELSSRDLEWYNIKERQAKFIVNACRTYEFFGYEWLIPLWDNSQFDFWSKVSIDFRYNRKLYFSCIKDSIKSTNSSSLIIEIWDKIKYIPIINDIIRRLKRIYLYYYSPLGFERMFDFKEYLVACIFKQPYFTVNDLLCEKQINRLNNKGYLLEHKKG